MVSCTWEPSQKTAMYDLVALLVWISGKQLMVHPLALGSALMRARKKRYVVDHAGQAAPGIAHLHLSATPQMLSKKPLRLA